MANLMDQAQFNQVQPNLNPQNNIYSMIHQARQNPRAFEEYVRRSNPQAYQQALMIRNMANPQQVVMQMAQQRGINSNVLRMLDI